MNEPTSVSPEKPMWFQQVKTPVRLGLYAALLTGVFCLLLPDYYRSEAHILPVDAKTGTSGLGQIAAAASALGIGMPSADGGDGNFPDIIASRYLREEVLNTEYEFHERAWRFGPFVEHKKTLFDYLKVKSYDRALKKLDTLLSSSKDPKSKLLTITAETRSAELSQQIVARTTKLLEAFVQEHGRTRGGAKATFAQARLQDARREMLKAELELKSFMDVNRNFVLSSDPSIRLAGARLEAEMKLRQQLVTTIAMSYEQALMEEKNDMPILNVLDKGSIPDEKSRPARSLYVLLAFFFTGLAVWVWNSRNWLSAYLSADEEEH